jgi:ribosomal protein L37AE/L43A
MRSKQAIEIAKGLNTQTHGDTKTARCPECKSVMTYFRIRSKSYVCRSCGNEWKKS